MNRLCTEISGEREWAFVNVNVRPYYAGARRRSPSRSASSSASSCPTGWWRRSPPDRCSQDRARVPGVARRGPAEGELPTFNGAQAAGCSPGGAGVRGRSGRLPAGEAGHDRQVARHRQPGGRALRARPGAALLGSIDSVTDDEIRDGIRLLAQTTGIFTETAGGVTAVLRKLAERGDIGADERVVAVITGDGLKTLDAVRGTSSRTRSSRRWRRSRTRSPEPPSALCNLPNPMAVTVKILRGCAASRVATPRPRSTAPPPWARCSTASTSATTGCARIAEDGDLRRLRERVRGWRGHPLPRRARHRGRGRRRGHDPPGRGRRQPSVFRNGAQGLIGCALVEALARGEEVVALSRSDLVELALRRRGAARAVHPRRGGAERQRRARAAWRHDVRTVFHLGAQTQVGEANARRSAPGRPTSAAPTCCSKQSVRTR